MMKRMYCSSTGFESQTPIHFYESCELMLYATPQNSPDQKDDKDICHAIAIVQPAMINKGPELLRM